MRVSASLFILVASLIAAGCGSGGPASPGPAADPKPAGDAGGSIAPVAHTPGEEVENPQYRSWAKAAPGTVVTQRTVSETEGIEAKTVTTITYKLLEVTPEFVKLESQASTRRYDGFELSNPPSTYQLPRRMTLPPGVKAEDFGKPKNVSDQGEETVTIAGQEYKAKWYTGKDRNEGGEVATKTWVSDDVPGVLLKSVSRTGGVKKIVTIELVAVKLP